jgi:hypothetical protein
MSIDPNCKNRIKPKLLREQKTEALLVFIRTTLEQYFKEINENKINVTIGTIEDTQYINDTLKKLLDNLQVCVVNSSYLRSLVITSSKNPILKMILKKEEPLMVYYDGIVKAIEINLQNGKKWIPELMVIALLSEWILEEEKSIYLYPFLNDLNYIELLEKYDLARLSSDDEKKEIIMDMYQLSTNLIKSLKNTSYKVKSRKKSRKK